MSNFKAFAAAVAQQYANMSQSELFHARVDGRELEGIYLNSFPVGTDPIYRKRTTHDGSYDRHFIRKMGNVVSIQNGCLVSIWDAPNLEYPYSVVAAAMGTYVRQAPVERIASLFRLPKNEKVVGYAATSEKMPDGSYYQWNHLHAVIADRHRCLSPDTVMGEARTIVTMMKRAMEEITPRSLQNILQMIEANTLYRGAEFKETVQAFLALQERYNSAPAEQQEFMRWENCLNQLARFRNSAIGTLAVDLSAGLSLGEATRAFVKKLDPVTYKRPTAPITQTMADKAMETIQSLDLEPALTRRYAKLSDVSINNVLWVGNVERALLKDGIAGILDTAIIKSVKTPRTAEDITAIDFIQDVLPNVRNLSVHFENRLANKLVSLTTAASSAAAKLFKWDNQFAWSYNGDTADAIKQRVKAAGGNVDADLGVRLSWYCADDLDLHCECPYGHIYYGNKMNILDVDMNYIAPFSELPVENLAFNRPRDGEYKIIVQQYMQRNAARGGFELEIESKGVVQNFSYNAMLRTSHQVRALTLHVKDGAIARVEVNDDMLQSSRAPQVIWGVQSESFVPVSVAMLSPNYWDGQATGNRHLFLFLENCANPESTRGIYNEFLRSDLEQHRKVFEVLGSKTKCPFEPEQLSGLGFSSTIRESVTVRAVGRTLNKLYKIHF